MYSSMSYKVTLSRKISLDRITKRFCSMRWMWLWMLMAFGTPIPFFQIKMNAQKIYLNVEKEIETSEAAPIFQHKVKYMGTTEYEDEVIRWFELADVNIYNNIAFKNERQIKQYYKIAYNIRVVYPIAIQIQNTITKCVMHLDSLPTKAAKDAYMKKMEKDLMNEYKPQLKKLTFQQGKLLIKLIDRQCNQTSYQLIKKYMGSFKANWYNAWATICGASLRKHYNASEDDRITERCIILIESGQL